MLQYLIMYKSENNVRNIALGQHLPRLYALTVYRIDNNNKEHPSSRSRVIAVMPPHTLTNVGNQYYLVKLVWYLLGHIMSIVAHVCCNTDRTCHGVAQDWAYRFGRIRLDILDPNGFWDMIMWCCVNQKVDHYLSFVSHCHQFMRSCPCHFSSCHQWQRVS
jgi:hypothetical protein